MPNVILRLQEGQRNIDKGIFEHVYLHIRNDNSVPKKVKGKRPLVRHITKYQHTYNRKNIRKTFKGTIF